MLCDLTRRNADLTPHSWDVGHLSLQRAKIRVIERQCRGFAWQSHLKLLSQVKRSDAQNSEEPGICYMRSAPRRRGTGEKAVPEWPCPRQRSRASRFSFQTRTLSGPTR